MRFSRQEYWSGLPFAPPGDLANPSIDPYFLCLLHCMHILNPLNQRERSHQANKRSEYLLCFYLSLDVLFLCWKGKESELSLLLAQPHRIHCCLVAKRCSTLCSTIDCSSPQYTVTLWITTNCGIFLERWEYQTTLPASWETCRQDKKQQFELNMENGLVQNWERSTSRLYIVILLI